MLDTKIHRDVQNYYGEVLKSKEDLLDCLDKH